MDGYSVDTQKGRVAAGETDSIWYPRTPRTGKRGVVLNRGRAAPGQYLDATNTPSMVRLAAFLASNGIPCIAGQFGTVAGVGNNWANDTVMTRVPSAWSVLQSATGCASDKFCGYGVSMGVAGNLRYTMLHPANVAAIYGTAPVSSIVNMYANNIGGWRSEIGTSAWGVTYPAALPSGADLLAQAHLASAVPCRLDYGTADTIIDPTDVTALAAAWGANCTATVVDTTHDHGDTLFGKTDPAAVLAFFIANGC